MAQIIQSTHLRTGVSSSRFSLEGGVVEGDFWDDGLGVVALVGGMVGGSIQSINNVPCVAS